MKKYVKKMVLAVVEENVYSFSELSEDAKKEAIQNRRQENNVNFWHFAEEPKENFQAMGKALGFKIVDYSYSLCSHSYTQLKLIDEGLRLKNVRRTMAYINNNWIEPYVGKDERCVKARNWMKDPKAGDFWTCPFSGSYCDYVLLKAYDEFIDYCRINSELVFDDFMTILGMEMTKTIMDEAEYRDSDEGIADELDDSEILFLEDGTVADIVNVA